MTALFKDGEELGVVSGFDVVSGCCCYFDIVFVAVTMSMWVWVSSGILIWRRCWCWFDIVFVALTVSMSTLQGQWAVDEVKVARVVVNNCKI